MHNLDACVMLIACLGTSNLMVEGASTSPLGVISIVMTILATMAVMVRNVIRILQDCKSKGTDILETVDSITEEISDAVNSVSAQLQSEDKISEKGSDDA